MADFKLDPKRTALIIQDLQNDVIIEGGAFADSGSPQHAKEQNVVENAAKLADACRAKGVPVIHVHYIVEAGAPALKQNAPLFQGVKDANAMVRGTWGAAPADGLEPKDGDYVVEKMRMSAFGVSLMYRSDSSGEKQSPFGSPKSSASNSGSPPPGANR